MPNWCNNSMSIHGPEAQVRAIVDSVRPGDENKELGLTTFMPQPKDESGELIGGVSWQYEMWGTKWGDCDTEISYEDYNGDSSTASLGYTTAWGPMSGLIKEISRQHPDVVIDIEYEEPGMNFFGVEQYKAGEVTYENHHEYDFSTGKITLADGWEMNFDTDFDDPEQDPFGTLNDAIYAAMEHLWTNKALIGADAPKDSSE